MNATIRFCAWVMLMLETLHVLLTPLVLGSTRQPYNYSDFIGAVVGFSITLPIIGRILGWW